MTIANQLTIARTAAVPAVIVLLAWDFPSHYLWGTAIFALAMSTDWFDGRLARRAGVSSNLGRLLDPIADKVLVLSMLVMLVGVIPAWVVAAVVARELLVSGLRLAAIERGIVISARDLGKLKTWAQALAACVAGLAAAGVWSDGVAWWAALVALAFTLLSGLDYARVAPRILNGEQPA